MKKLNSLVFLFPLALTIAALFLNCASMRKDLFINSPKEQMERNLSELEVMIVALEAVG